jgi:hypothetical protein
MKKYLFLVLAFLLAYGTANATNIPQVTDPKNYPTVWTELVYNGSGSDIATGMCVVWDYDTSDSDAGTIYDDTCAWVKTCDDESSPWTAGVTTIGQGIANGAVGRIIIRGPAVVHRAVEGTAVTVNTQVSAGSTGYVEDEVVGSDEAILGVVIKASAAGNDIEGDIGTGSSLIMIQPTLENVE